MTQGKLYQVNRLRLAVAGLVCSGLSACNVPQQGGPTVTPSVTPPAEATRSAALAETADALYGTQTALAATLAIGATSSTVVVTSQTPRTEPGPSATYPFRGTAVPPIMAPSPVPTSAEIVTFYADKDFVDSGGSFSLAWETTAPAASLCRVMLSYQLGQCDSVMPTGSKVIELAPTDREWAAYLLFAVNSAGESTGSSQVTVKVGCPDPWYFDDHPDLCAGFPARQSEGVAQYFENGLMVWQPFDGYATIHVLIEGGIVYNITDSWEAGQPESDEAIVPPPGSYQPVRGFGKAWRGDPIDYGIREQIGWALAPEFAFPVAYQCDWQKYSHCYLATPDGLVDLGPWGSGWELWEGAE